jgi:hypothetical protein
MPIALIHAALPSRRTMMPSPTLNAFASATSKLLAPTGTRSVVIFVADFSSALAAASPTSMWTVREVSLGEGTVPQAREILDAQFQGAPAPYASVIPEGTVLRAFYVSERGDAFVDISPEVSTRHPGGSATELLTVYAIVNAITANLPTIQRVQILLDGREADTLAGHVDLRRPLQQDLSFVREPKVE